MKILKDKKGFTLIELLAVIVVLAIITVLASTSVLSYLSTARKSALATEGSEAISAASDLVSLINLNLVSNASNYSYGSSNYCFDLQDLVDEEALDKDLDGYEGYVIAVKNTTGNGYTYTITMHNDLYTINGISGSVDSDDVDDYDSTLKYDCTSAGYRS